MEENRTNDACNGTDNARKMVQSVENMSGTRKGSGTRTRVGCAWGGHTLMGQFGLAWQMRRVEK